MTDTTELRAAFEKAFAERDGFLGTYDPDHGYVSHVANAAWWAYRTAHASATQQHEGLRKDADRYRLAISSDDNAEALFSAVLMHRYQSPEFVNAAFDAAVEPHGTASTGAASSPISADSTTSKTNGLVWCGCGDGYPGDSFEGGFMAAKGKCSTCDHSDEVNGEVAINRNIETSPSAIDADLTQQHEAEVSKLREEIDMLRGCVEYAEGQLTNLQPHIEQACYPKKAGFIDNYVDPVLERLRAALSVAGDKT